MLKSMLFFALALSPLAADAGKMVSGGGISGRRVLICSERRGELYSSFNVFRPNAGDEFIAQYSDQKNVTGADFVRLECVNDPSGFFCIDPNEDPIDRLYAVLVKGKSGIEVEIRRLDRSDASDRLPCKQVASLKPLDFHLAPRR